MLDSVYICILNHKFFMYIYRLYASFNFYYYIKCILYSIYCKICTLHIMFYILYINTS